MTSQQDLMNLQASCFSKKKKKLGGKSQHFFTWMRGLNFDPSWIFGSMTQPAGLMTSGFNPGRV
jgi:hypothetical protein